MASRQSIPCLTAGKLRWQCIFLSAEIGRDFLWPNSRQNPEFFFSLQYAEKDFQGIFKHCLIYDYIPLTTGLEQFLFIYQILQMLS